MRLLTKTLLAAGLLASLPGAALAQGFGVELGVRDRDRDRGRGDVIIERRGRRDRDVVIERRERPRRTVCRTVVRERVTPSGVVIRRPTEVCRTVNGRYN